MENLNIVYVPISELKPSEYNPRKWNESQIAALKESLQRFGMVDPIVCNKAEGRENVVVGGHFRLKVAKDLELKEMPVVYVNIPEIEREKELNIRLNKNLGEFDLAILKDFGEDFLKDVGFDTIELDEIFEVETTPEHFDLKRELEKLNISEVTIKKGDMFDLDGSRLRCGDSMIEADMLALMGGEKADMCFTDPPYILDYLRGKKKNGKPTEGFGLKRDRKYLGTDSLPENFTDLWMANVAQAQKTDFSIIVYENPKNLRTIWNALEKHWRYRNTIVWHLSNRVQGFSAKYKFFSKHDVALVGTSGEVVLNDEPEDDPLFQEQYETALFATSGSPHWEGPGKGKKYCPTDFVDFVAADEKSSGQGIIFGTKPVEILLPYLKVLTKRGDLVLEPFGGSGSTLIAANKLGRRCYVMEKSEIYTAVIIARWEKTTGKKAKKIS
ncbi:MAG: DNA methyltransferase [Patescibacteria group bacterium]